MNRTKFFVAAVWMVVANAAFALADAQAAAVSPLAVEVNVAPAEGHSGTYTCTARIADAATGEVLSEPMVVFRGGEEAKARSGVQVPGQP